MAAHGVAPIILQARRRPVREVDGHHVAGNDSDDGRVPGETRTHDSDIDFITGGSHQVPAITERIGKQRNDQLPLDQQVTQIVRKMIGKSDRHEGVSKANCGFAHGKPPAAGGRHKPAHSGVDTQEQEPEADQTEGANE